MVRTTARAARLRPKARILRIIGDELISSETVAVIELVKNAYDADATRVLIRFRGPLTLGKGSIEVIDNGHGMSRETVETAWMEPATLVKRRRTRSEQKGRRVLGEKGVGRFAASRLAEYLEVITRHIDSDGETRVLFDWRQFDDERRYLDEIEVPLEERIPAEIVPGGAIRALWDEAESPKSGEQTHGTILRMKRLRSEWEREQVETLRLGLSRLISPFFFEDHLTKQDSFVIRLELPTPFEELSGPVEPPEALKNPHHILGGHVDKAGNYKLTFRLRGRREHQRLEGRFVFPDGHAPRCGPFDIDLRVWDRDQASMAELAREYGSTLSDIRRDLDQAAGINIYRDGFRVLPYGEPRNDWLRLDLRRVQNPTLRLSNNQIVGYVLISADENPKLRDQSNREGLIEAPAFDDLRELVKMVLAELETRRYALRRRLEKPPQRQGSLFERFDLRTVRELVRKRHPADTELLELLEEKERDVEAGVEAVQEVLARYQRLATLGQLIDIVLHEGRAPLSKIGNEADLGLREIKRSSSDGSRVVVKLGQRLTTIRAQSDVVATVFRKIEPFSGRRRGRPARVRLEQVIASAFSVLEGEIAEVDARIILPKTETLVTVDEAEVQEVIVNLLLNSLYWLRQVPKDRRQIAVQVRRKGDDEVQILFSDSGPGVKPEFRDRIFDPYFSTKPDGIGLGLTIAGDIIKEYYRGDLELLESGRLPGATFKITLRRRV